MSNVLAANVPPISLASLQSVNFSKTDGKMMLWKLTRVMKAAGWVYKSSGRGNAVGSGKDTSGNPNNDFWNGYGAQIAGQSGSTADFTAFSTPTVTVTGLTGMTSSSVGRVLIISGAATATNNGVFRIVAFTNSTTVDIHNSLGASSDSNDGRLTWQEMDFAAYVSGQTGSLANITTVSTGRIVTITGLTGMTPLSTNRYLTITNAADGANNGTFKILSYISDTSVTIINSSGVASDANNGTIIWKEMDPLLENYLLLQQNTWLCMQGPSTLKIPITTAATGTFLRGENITQTTTGAQGEVIGYVFDTVDASGFLVVMPRVNGSGDGALGWGTNSINGDTSGATVTPNANPAEFTREVVFYCPAVTGTYNAMKMWMQCVDGYSTGTENAYRFSTLQASAGCTATVPPGAGGTTIAAGSNAASLPQATINVAATSTFPASGTIFVVTTNGAQTVTYTGTTSTTFTGCTGGTGTMITGNAVTPTPGTMVVMGDSLAAAANINAWGAVTNVVNFGYSHFMCADATYEAGRSADGSFCGAVSVTLGSSLNTNGSYIGCLWTRCDAQEDGDVDPYVFYMPGSNALYTPTNITLLTQYSLAEHFSAATTAVPTGVSVTWNAHNCRGWRRRGFASGDAYKNFGLFTIAHSISARSFSAQANGTLNQYNDSPNIINRNASVVGEPIWVISTQTNLKMRKGIMRWARLVNAGVATNLYNGGLYIQLSSSLPAFIVGPWDKRTPPIK